MENSLSEKNTEETHSLGKRVIDGLGGNVKTLVYQKMMNAKKHAHSLICQRFC